MAVWALRGLVLALGLLGSAVVLGIAVRMFFYIVGVG